MRGRGLAEKWHGASGVLSLDIIGPAAAGPMPRGHAHHHKVFW